MGNENSLKIQYGKETTRGTAVAATKKWMGSADIPVDRKPKHPKDTLGQRVRSSRTEILQLLADPIKLAMDGDTGGYYQGLPLLFGITLLGGVTPTEQTPSQQDYVWDFIPPLSGASNPDTITLEKADSDQEYEVEYVLGKTIDIDWAFGEDAYVNVSCEAFGRQVTKSTATAGLTNPTINGINADTGKIFIDPTWATLGATQKTSFLRSGSLQINAGNHPKFLGAGNRYFDTHGEGDLIVTGNLILEGGAAAISVLDDFQTGTKRAIRINWTGPQIGSGVNHLFQIDTFVSYDEVKPFSGFADGNTLYAVVFSNLSDNLATPHSVAVKVITNQNTY